MVLGIIAEYNPFHNGHLYHLLKSKEKTGADKVIVVLGGNFTQRGEASIVDKWTKAEMALKNGADLVIELPTLYSISSVENFAEGAIKIFDSLKIVDTISFGTEAEDINKLNIIANVLYEETKEYKEILEQELKKGVSFPKAREKAVVRFLRESSYREILNSPNNILGIEYLKALKKFRSKIKPVCVCRKDVGHLGSDYNGEIANATSIRRMILLNHMRDVKRYTTPSSFAVLNEEIQNGHLVRDICQFENIMIYNLRNMSMQEIANLPDVTEGLENLIKKTANSCNTIDEFVERVSSKRYTQTRIKRIMLYALLGITKKDMSISKRCSPYIRVLGMNEKGKKMLSLISRRNQKIDIVTSVKKFMDNNADRNLKHMIEKDILSTDIYTLGYDKDSFCNLDYTNKMK